MGGEDDPSIHVGSEIAPSEFIEFDNNLVGVNKFPREGIEEKDVLAPLALMGEMVGHQCMVYGEITRMKLIAGGSSSESE